MTLRPSFVWIKEALLHCIVTSIVPSTYRGDADWLVRILSCLALHNLILWLDQSF